MSLTLHSALETLYGQERRRSDFRVEDTARLLRALGDPHRRWRSVHVAGTHGKGSCCAMIERALRDAGHVTGLYTSPHLVDFRERIRVRGRWLPEDDLGARLEHLQSLPESRGRTFFEVATALGFDALARHGVTWGVIEVGLGGRLDATNVLDPEVAAITRVGLDHTEILGDSLASVAREKAGIVKPGRPLVVGAQEPAAAAEIAAIAEARGAPVQDATARVRVHDVRTGLDGSELTADVPPWGRLQVRIGLRGRHQVENAVVALAALGTLADRGVELPASAVRDGLAAARWPGRLEPCPTEPRLWWDGAHHPEALARTLAAWRDDLRLPPPDALVFAVSRDKDAADMLRRLRAAAPEATLHVTRTRNERALPVERLAAIAETLPGRWESHAGVAEAIASALGSGRGRVLVAGSLFAVGEAMQALGGAPGEQT